MVMKTGISYRAMTFMEFVDLLRDCGWEATYDTNFTKIKQAFDNDLTVFKPEKYKVDLK